MPTVEQTVLASLPTNPLSLLFGYPLSNNAIDELTKAFEDKPQKLDQAIKAQV